MSLSKFTISVIITSVLLISSYMLFQPEITERFETVKTLLTSKKIGIDFTNGRQELADLELKIMRATNVAYNSKIPTVSVTVSRQNLIMFESFISKDTVLKLINEILELSKQLSSSDIIYLWIDSPGGSVGDLIKVIAVMDSIPQKIHTISGFAFSAAFGLYLHGDRRYYNESSKIGDHPGTIGSGGSGVSGEAFAGNFDSRSHMVKKIGYQIVSHNAQILGISVEKYLSVFSSEVYFIGNEILDKGMATHKIKMHCLDLSYCPLIPRVVEKK